MCKPTQQDIDEFRQDLINQQYEYEHYMHEMSTDYDSFVENEIIKPYYSKLVEFANFLKQVEQKHKSFGWEFDSCKFIKDFLE